MRSQVLRFQYSGSSLMRSSAALRAVIAGRFAQVTQHPTFKEGHSFVCEIGFGIHLTPIELCLVSTGLFDHKVQQALQTIVKRDHPADTQKNRGLNRGMVKKREIVNMSSGEICGNDL
jgi:hypothetical protein